MLTAADIQSAANRLFTAEQSRVQTGLLSIMHPQMTMDDAYAVQAAFVAKRHALGRKTIGWKIGLTSKAMQSALNITTPDSGVLMDCNAGDYFPSFIRMNGIDHLVFYGRAPVWRHRGRSASVGRRRPRR